MWKIVSVFVFLVFLSTNLVAQKFVQLEVFNSAKTIKYSPGQKIVFKTKEFPNEWQKMKIEKIMYEDNLIVFTQALVHIDDITHIKRRNVLARALSGMLYVFAGSSLIFGGIGDIATGQLSPGLFLFTIGPAALGFFLDKVVSTKVYHINKTSRLRLLDIDMY